MRSVAFSTIYAAVSEDSSAACKRSACSSSLANPSHSTQGATTGFSLYKRPGLATVDRWGAIQLNMDEAYLKLHTLAGAR